MLSVLALQEKAALVLPVPVTTKLAGTDGAVVSALGGGGGGAVTVIVTLELVVPPAPVQPSA